METRLEINKKILKRLEEVIEKYPDLRFGQLLIDMNIIKYDKFGRVIDPFYEESDKTLEGLNSL